MRLAAVPLAVLILVAPVGAQQQAAPAGTLTFTTASVEPAERASVITLGQTSRAQLLGEVSVLPGDRLEGVGSLRKLIEYAYGFDQRWDGAAGADPLLDQWFRVSARGAAGSFDALTPDGLPAARHMLQQLLKERFGLAVAVRDDTRRAMVLRRVDPASVGPLRAIRGGCLEGTRADADARGRVQCAWNQQGSRLKAVVKDFDAFANRISGMSRQDVVNETGLVGAFAFETSYDPYTIMPAPFGGNPHELNQPSFAEALKKDLGLVVDYANHSVRVLVVTQVEALREN